MENESIFTPLKSNSPSSASTMANNSTKAKKIENFKKVSMYEKFALSNVSQFIEKVKIIVKLIVFPLFLDG